jgi:hypothetical protein
MNIQSKKGEDKNLEFKNELTPFNRLIPKGGVKVYLQYFDVNDTPHSTRKYMKNVVSKDKEYIPFFEHRHLIKRGNVVDRRYGVYIYHNESLVGNFIFYEYLDSPFGYSKNDFYYIKWVMPEYRNSNYSRYASGDLMHMLFLSQAAERLYALPIAKNGKLDPKQPCIGSIHKSDGPVNQKFILRKQIIHTEWKDYILSEYNAKIYKSMNLKTYLGYNYTEEVAKDWIERMDEAANKVKEVIDGSTTT